MTSPKNFKISLVLGIMALAFTQAPDTNAQAPRREPTPNDTLKSTEVLPDNRVTFRIYAPKAGEVTLGGDWISQGLGEGGRLKKDDQGVWSITVGPLPPDFYSYSFNVDGVRTVDPKNAMNKQGLTSLESMFLLPGKEAAYADHQSVPHGTIHQVWYESATLGLQRRMHLYTPPGYDRSRELLPVFYLLHGGGDEDSGWSTIGRAGFILDNLLAAKKAKPMIVVMPNGSLPRATNAPVATPGSNAPADVAARAAAQERFTKELMNEVVPFVEKHYRVRTGREHRAMAGLSMGGGQTLRVFTAHPDQFGYVAIWSAGIGGQNAGDFEQRNADFLKQAAKINQEVKLVSIGVGDKDFALNGSRSLEDVFKKNGLKHEFILSGGGHTWINWRHYLHDYAARLFQ